MKKALLFLFAFLTLITLFGGVYALCESGQININSADATELDKLSGIGPAYANNIISSRPFSSVDDLIDVKGIGPITLDKIKTQGLACVTGEEETTQEDNAKEESVPVEEPEEKINNEETINEEDNINNIVNADDNNYSKTIITGEEVKTIILSSNPKDIKSETDKEQLNKNKFVIYGLITFCILLAFLFIFKKKDNKNEFE
jgi:competence ComEA-like helix-hairpin-helix protein